MRQPDQAGVRRPGLIEQVDAVPVRREPARCRDSGFPASLAGEDEWRGRCGKARCCSPNAETGAREGLRQEGPQSIELRSSERTSRAREAAGTAPRHLLPSPAGQPTTTAPQDCVRGQGGCRALRRSPAAIQADSDMTTSARCRRPGCTPTSPAHGVSRVPPRAWVRPQLHGADARRGRRSGTRALTTVAIARPGFRA
jgi:hypothetical protein